jgi:hypothetical protein
MGGRRFQEEGLIHSLPFTIHGRQPVPGPYPQSSSGGLKIMGKGINIEENFMGIDDSVFLNTGCNARKITS